MAKEIKFVGLGPIARYLNESKETDVVDGISNAYGEIKNFKDCDVVFGPDGTRYDPKYICSVVEDSINIINSINEGVIKDFLAALPFVYTFEIPTMATDGKHIFMNPGFIVELLAYCDGSPIGVAFVIIHEVYHNLFKHAEREAADPGKFTDHRKCNRAQDYEINWVIEHSYPDRSYDSEAEANAEGETLLDENGNRKQLFTGITNTCKGLFDEKYRSNTWEEIYDMLDNKEEEEEEPQETDIEIDYSDDFKEGMRDGAEDALRILRAQGLVESVSLPFRLLINMTMLNEAKVVMKGTYDDGYKEGYKRVMDAIKGLLNGQQGGGGGGNKGSQPKEVKIDGMPTIKPKFNIPPMQGQSKNNAGPSNPPIELPKSSQQGGEGDSKDSADKNTQDQLGGKHTGTGSSNISQNNPGQQNQQGQQSGGNGGSQGGQSQDGQQNQSGDGNGGGGQGGDQNGQQGQGSGSGSSSGSQDGQQGGQQGGGQGGGSQNGQQGDHTGTGGNGQMSTDEAKQKMSKISNTSLGDKDGKAQVIGIAKGGYSGRGGTAAGNHVISEDDGRKLASNAGHDDGSDGEAYAGKSDPFNDKNAVLKALAGLKKASIVLGSNGTPGCGLIDNIGDVLVSLYEPTVDWKKMLKRYMKGYMIKMQDVGYSKKGIIYGRYNRFKDREGESARRILICIDTSGSVVYSGDYLQHIVANVAEITCNLGIRTTNVIQFSDGVYKDTEFTMKNVPPASQFAIKADKSGGTSFMPVFNYIKKNYTDAHKPFQAVIFFTDDDVYSCRLEDPNNIKWSNRVIWMVLSKGEHPLPYGKTINIGPDDFKKQLSFETTDFETEDESEELELENTNESINRNCMNKRIYSALNEGNPFGNYKAAKEKKLAAAAAAADAQAANGEVPTRTAAAPAPPKKKLSIMDKRKLAIDALKASGAREGVMAAAIQETYDTLKPWFDKFFSEYRFYKNQEDVRSYDSKYIVITSYNTIEWHGNLRLVGPSILENWPEGLVFESVYGTLDIGMCSSLTQLPKGLPMTVRGDLRITNMRRLENLDGAPVFVDGKVIVTACPNLDSLFGAPRKCEYFYSDKFTEDEYLDYVAANYNIKESANSKDAHHIDEAFNSNILSKLARNPANKAALNSMKNINILWSEIPDEIVNPIYGNVAKSLAKRRDDNSSGEYGVYIWCDKNNKINIIGTGNNLKEWGDGRSWLYLDANLIDTINDRINIVRRACNGYSGDIDTCVEYGIKYDNKNVSAICSKGTIRGARELTYTHLLLLPDLCYNAYLIQGTKDPRSSMSDNKVAHFSYRNSENSRSILQKDRAQAIAGIIVQGRNLNPDDPSYKRYYEKLYTTELKLIQQFTQVRTIFGFRGILNEMITSMSTNANMVRKSLFAAHDNNIISDRVFDGLYAAFTSVYMKKFYNEANQLLTAVEEIISNKKYKEQGFDAESINAAFEYAYARENTDSSWDRNNRESRLYREAGQYQDMVKWFKTYTTTITTFAEILSVLSKGKRGDTAAVEEYAEKYLK